MNKLYFLIDLQLLAEDDPAPAAAPAMNATTSEGLSAEDKIFYDKLLIKRAKAKLVHAQFGQKRKIPKNGGKSVEFREFAALPKATTPLTEGVTPEGNLSTVSTVTAYVSQHGDYMVHTDMLELTSIDNVIVEDTKILGDQGGLTMDTVVRNEMQSGTNVIYCPKIGTGGVETAVTSRAGLDETCQLTVDVVQQAAAQLKAANAPKIGDSYVAIIHPFVAYDLMRDDDWKEPNTYSDPKNRFEGELGKIAGVRFVESSEAKIYTGDGCPADLAVFGTLFFGENAYGVIDVEGGNMQTIIKQKGSAGTADPLDQRSSVGWKATGAAKILIQPYLIRVESCSKRYSKKAQAN